MARSSTRTHKLYTTDKSNADAPDAFKAGELLTYPDDDWWAEVNPPRQPDEQEGPPPPPTRAAYWKDRSPSRLLNPSPLPREGKARAKERAQKARSYFASLAAYERRRTRGTRAAGMAEWRIVFRGAVGTVSDTGPFDLIGEGRQFSPWQRVARGVAVSHDAILAQYYQTCRRAVALEAKAHAPKWDASLGTFDAIIGYNDSDKGVIFPESRGDKPAGAWIEFRLVD